MNSDFGPVIRSGQEKRGHGPSLTTWGQVFGWGVIFLFIAFLVVSASPGLRSWFVPSTGATVTVPNPEPAEAPVLLDDCDVNYTDACVAVADDVDCDPGSGNGPEWVSGPVRVVGVDIYDLDRDGDGVGCD